MNLFRHTAGKQEDKSKPSVLCGELFSMEAYPESPIFFVMRSAVNHVPNPSICCGAPP